MTDDLASELGAALKRALDHLDANPDVEASIFPVLSVSGWYDVRVSRRPRTCTACGAPFDATVQQPFCPDCVAYSEAVAARREDEARFRAHIEQTLPLVADEVTAVLQASGVLPADMCVEWSAE